MIQKASIFNSSKRNGVNQMLIDPVLDHIENRVKDTLWLHEEITAMNIRQVAAINELIKSALTDTRKHFENAVIGVDDE